MRDDARPEPVVAAERRRLALIFNPTAGRRRRRRFAVALERLSAGAVMRVMPTQARGDAERVAAHAASVIVANGRYYAGRYVVAGAADLGRPELHVCLFGRGGRLNAMRYSLAMLVDRLQRLPDLVVQPGARITIDGPAGEP